jgi:deazaflavin-dependent oxidoreductase (nitroreductase family)
MPAFWRVMNPLARPLAVWMPWWVAVETVGNRTGQRRRTPLAAGPHDAAGMWLIAVHGRHSAWVRNLEASPVTRVAHRGRWREATATVRPLDVDVVRRFNLYARSGPRLVGVDPVLVRLDYR